MSNGASKTCAIAGAVLAAFVFHFVFARDIFPTVPGGEFNYGWDRAIVTMIVGALGGAVGALFGSVIERILAE